jgi:hypothetical protein
VRLRDLTLAVPMAVLLKCQSRFAQMRKKITHVPLVLAVGRAGIVEVGLLAAREDGLVAMNGEVGVAVARSFVGISSWQSDFGKCFVTYQWQSRAQLSPVIRSLQVPGLLYSRQLLVWQVPMEYCKDF